VSNDNARQHSGSRWEPPPTTEPLAGRAMPAAALGSTPASPRPGGEGGRRRRGPLLAVLAAVLTLGASTAGIAYVQAAQEPGTGDPAAAADSSHDRGSGAGVGVGAGDRDGDGDGDGRWGDHHRDGDRGDDGPRVRDGDDAGAAGTSGQLPS